MHLGEDQFLLWNREVETLYVGAGFANCLSQEKIVCLLINTKAEMIPILFSHPFVYSFLMMQQPDSVMSDLPKIDMSQFPPSFLKWPFFYAFRHS